MIDVPPALFPPDCGDDEPMLLDAPVGVLRPAGGMKVVGLLPDPDPDDPEPPEDTPDGFGPLEPTVKGTFTPPDGPACGVEEPLFGLGAPIVPTGLFLPTRGGAAVRGPPPEPLENPEGDPLFEPPAGGADTAGFGVDGALKPDGGFVAGAGAARRFEPTDGERENEPLLREGI